MTRQTNLRTHIFAGAAIALALAGGLTACSSDDTADKGKDDKKTQSPEGKDSYQASISRTADGVPHISGKTFGDVVFGQGYASGQDRTCDLADQVIKIRGERAKYLGAGDEDANLNSDIQWRTIGIFDSATKDWEKIPAEVQDMFKAFTAGWNSHLEEVGVDKISGWCAAEKWVRPLEPSETYAYARSIALSASGARIGAYIPTAQPPSAESAEPAGAASPG
ncbi:MAG: penicillin acylase family protein, partial [Acidimicrobiales bacterium]|nr:penicillin acylase family protein [Acidimicrobiales bacterium]